MYEYINPFISAVFAAFTLNGRLRDDHSRFFIVREAVDVYRYCLTVQSVLEGAQCRRYEVLRS
jgi:hypothetical protein